MKLTLGSDPEYFFIQNNLITPPVFSLGEGESIRPGEFPYRIYFKNEDFSVESDGCAFELTTAVHTNWEDLFNNIQEGIIKAKSLLKGAGLDGILQAVPSGTLNEKFLIRETQITGCSPDYDAYNCNWCAKEKLEGSLTRYAGGHIHLGFEKHYVEALHKNPFPLIQLLSLFVGIPALVKSEKKEEELVRLKKYGQPGRFRTPKWGLEYRSPSNRWTVQKDLAEEILTNIQTVAEIALEYEEKTTSILSQYVPILEELFKDSDLTSLEEVYQEARRIL